MTRVSETFPFALPFILPSLSLGISIDLVSSLVVAAENSIRLTGPCDIVDVGYSTNYTFLLPENPSQISTLNYSAYTPPSNNNFPRLRSYCELFVYRNINVQKLRTPLDSGINTYQVHFFEEVPRDLQWLGRMKNVLIIRIGQRIEYYGLKAAGNILVALPSPSFPTRDNFRGEKFVWVAVPKKFFLDHFLYYREARDKLLFLPSYILTLMKALNGTPDIVFVNEIGTAGDTSTGLYHEVCCGQGHMSFAPMLREIHATMVTATYMFPAGLAFLTGLPTVEPSSFLMWKTLRAIFEFQSGAMWATLGICVSITLSICQRNIYRFLENFVKLQKSLLLQPPPSSIFRGTGFSGAGKIAVALWMLVGIRVTMNIQTRITSALTTSEYHVPPTTFEALVLSQYTIKTRFKFEPAAAEMFLDLVNAGNTMALRLMEKMSNDSTQHIRENCLRATQENRTVCLGERELGLAFAGIYLVDRNGQGLYRQSDTLATTFKIPIINNRLANLVEKISHITLTMQEAGIVLYLTFRNQLGVESWGRRAAIRRNASGTMYQSERNTRRLVNGGREILMLKYLYAVAHLMAFIMLLVEITCFLGRRYNNLVKNVS